jgi:hypothetical protein
MKGSLRQEIDMTKKRMREQLRNMSMAALSFITCAVLTSTAQAQAAPNLMEDPQFESGVSNFAAQDASSSIAQSAVSPLQGANSLQVKINGWGNNIWWHHDVGGQLASSLFVQAHLRSDVASGSTLSFCAMIYYADGVSDLKCTTVPGAVGDKGVVSAQLALDSTKPLQTVNIRMWQEGSDPAAFTLDEAVVNLAVVGDGGGGGTSNPPAATALMQDPEFDSGVSHFEAQDASSSVQQSSTAPLDGANSLSLSINGFGNFIWWHYDFTGGRASHFLVGAHLRSDVASGSSLQFCAAVNYADGTEVEDCKSVSGTVGDKGQITAQVDLDSTKPLLNVNIRMSQQGSAPITFTLDEAQADLVVVAPPTGSTTNPATCDDPTPPTPSAYPGFTYNLPVNRPFISLAHYAATDQSSVAYSKFKAAADAAIAGNPPDQYSAAHAVMMFRITNDPKYINDAISRVDAMVSADEALIASNKAPLIAGDDYLNVGSYLEQLALTYDYGFNLLSASQKTRWTAYAQQALTNVWDPPNATWGGWSGWAVCPPLPGDNYYYSFLRATMLWGLATKDNHWIQQVLQQKKFQTLINYYAQFPGGGTREGTGYGTTLMNLYKTYIYWKDSTTEDLANLSPHTRQTIDYWVHATVPTLDRFAPLGDLSRESIPNLYDYQENLVEGAVTLTLGTAEARRGTWWLQSNSVNGVSHASNLWGDLLQLDTPQAPTDLVYQATGAGVLFARSSWSADASWLSFVAGKYEQSHQRQEQGSFTFFKSDWLAVTNNIWSHSGIHQEVDTNNAVRFQRADGTTIPQSISDSVQSSMTVTNSGGVVSVAADLANAYVGNNTLVSSWTRNLHYSGDSLQVTDACTVASGVTPVFQVQVPVKPVIQSDGSVVAGHLHIVSLQGVGTPQIIPMSVLPSTEDTNGDGVIDANDPPVYSQGYRIDYTSTAGCSFNFQLSAQ